MKILKISLSLVLLVCASNLFAQIEYKENFWGGRFYENGEKIKYKQVKSIFKTVPEAHQELLKGKKNANIVQLLSIGALTLEAYALVEIFKNKEEDNSLVFQLGGLALIGISYHFDRKKTSQFVNASNIFNKENSKTSIIVNPSITTNGLGLTVKF